MATQSEPFLYSSFAIGSLWFRTWMAVHHFEAPSLYRYLMLPLTLHSTAWYVIAMRPALGSAIFAKASALRSRWCSSQPGQLSVTRTTTLPFGPVTFMHVPHEALLANSGKFSATTSRSFGLASYEQLPSPVAS